MAKKLILLFLAVIMIMVPLNTFAVETDESSNTEVSDNVENTEAKGSDTEETTKAPEKVKKSKGKWKVKKHYTYFYRNKKALKGLKKIGKRTYYFDKNGKQRTGWQKIGKNYYYFKIGNGKNGYMLKEKKVNKIYLKKSGKAKVTKSNKKRLKTLVYATKLVEKATKPDMKKKVKLKKCYDYILKNYKYKGSLRFHYSKRWEEEYAYFMYTNKHGSCYNYGATFAFAANACGYKKCYAVSSGGHGWAEVDGRVTDVSWENQDKRNHYFHFDINLSGKHGRPNYKRYGKYRKKI